MHLFPLFRGLDIFPFIMTWRESVGHGVIYSIIFMGSLPNFVVCENYMGDTFIIDLLLISRIIINELGFKV